MVAKWKDALELELGSLIRPSKCFLLRKRTCYNNFRSRTRHDIPAMLLPIPWFVLLFGPLTIVLLALSHATGIVPVGAASPSAACKWIRDRPSGSDSQIRENLLRMTTALSFQPRFTAYEKLVARQYIMQELGTMPGLRGSPQLLSYSSAQYRSAANRSDEELRFGTFDAQASATNVWASARNFEMDGAKDGTNQRHPIVIVSAHYDSVEDSNAVFDNAAGVAVAIETMRLLSDMASAATNDSKITVWLLLFDNEEQLGSTSMGSHYFVNSLDRDVQARIKAVLNIDSVGAWSKDRGSQALPSMFPLAAPSAYWRVRSNGFRANFIAAISAGSASKQVVKHLVQTAERCRLGRALPLPFSSPSTNGLNLLPINVPLSEKSTCSVLGSQLGMSQFCRSDHANFWKHGIPAVHLTDTANFRTKCYHQQCDDVEQLGDENLESLVDLTKILVASVLAYA